MASLIDGLSRTDRPIQERMVWHLVMAEDELGQRVGEGLGITADDVRGLAPLQTQTLAEAELQRAANLGENGPRDVSGLTLTHCGPRPDSGRGPQRCLPQTSGMDDAQLPTAPADRPEALAA